MSESEIQTIKDQLALIEEIYQKDRRIAELEAEVTSLKLQDGMTYPEALKALNEMADFIRQEEIKVQTALESEEGEG